MRKDRIMMWILFLAMIGWFVVRNLGYFSTP